MNLRTKHKIFLASLAYHPVRFARKLAGKEMHGTFARRSLRWELDLREVVDFMIYLSGAFEHDLNHFIRHNLREGACAVDIGANIGAHTLEMARQVGSSGKVYAVEATEFAFEKLGRNIQLNPELGPRIDAVHALLQAQPEPDQDRPPIRTIPSSWPFQCEEQRHPSHQGVGKEVGAARCTSLDVLVEEKGIDHIDLLKLDVDGNEWDVLSGSRQTLETMRPVLIMELAPDYHDADGVQSFPRIHHFLTDLNYSFHDLKGRQLPTSLQELAASIPAAGSKNAVLLPGPDSSIRFNR